MYAVLGAVLLAAVACQDSTSPSPIVATPARISAAQNAAPNDYIVVFRDDESDPDGQANALVRAHGGSLRFVYRAALKGFAVANLPDAAVEALQRNPRIAFVERDGIVTADDAGSQTSATWGIDRIDQRDLPLSTTYAWDSDGTGVTVYIIDTGILTTHTQFGGRASGGFTSINDGNGTSDCHGHGTHVSGTVGGSTYGVAKNVNLVAVRVLNCSGSGSDAGVIAGIDWVTQNHASSAVANMSLGGGPSAALDQALTNSVNAGVTYAVAAGNSSANACNYSPSRAPAALTVGATTSTDARSSFSNWGTCVDIMAPGSGITSAWNTSTTATNTISGTSMASPHVAGAAALYLSNGHLNATPADVEAALESSATSGKVTGLTGTGTPNLLLYTHFGTAPPPPPGGSPPVASLTKSCNGFTCTFTNTSTGATNPATWDFNGKTAVQTGPEQYAVTYGPRQSSSVTVTVSNGDGNDSATQNVVCNPRKCQ